jgi:hypothetical protein
MSSKRFLRDFVTEKIVRAVVMVITIIIIIVTGSNSRCLMAQSNPEGNIYTYFGLRAGTLTKDKLQQNAPIIWDYIKGLEEAQFVTSEKAYSVLILMQPYSDGMFNPETAEWIAVASSIPEAGEEVKVLIVRLDYLTFNLKGIDKFTYPGGKEISLEDAIPIMEDELRLHGLVMSIDVCDDVEECIAVFEKVCGGPVCFHKEDVQISGEDYIYSVNPSDFGGTIIVNKYVEKPIFLASTVWDGGGHLIIPQPSPLPERNIYIEGTQTIGISKEVRIPVKIKNAPCEVDDFVFEVTYDANVFEYTGLERGDLTEDFKAVGAYSVDAGRLRIKGYIDEHGISEGASGYLVWLKFKLKSGEEDDTYLFQLENLDDSLSQFSRSGGCLSLRCKGDINGDGIITPGDALIAFRCYLGAGPCLDCSDVNKNGHVTSEDALCIFRAYLGTPSCLDYLF